MKNATKAQREQIKRFHKKLIERPVPVVITGWFEVTLQVKLNGATRKYLAAVCEEILPSRDSLTTRKTMRYLALDGPRPIFSKRHYWESPLRRPFYPTTRLDGVFTLAEWTFSTPIDMPRNGETATRLKMEMEGIEL